MFTKKDVAIMVGPIVGTVVFIAANVAAVKIKEHRAKKAEPKDDVITAIMKEAQK